MCVGAYKTPSGLLKHNKRHVQSSGTKCRVCQNVFKTDLEKWRHECIKTEPDQSDDTDAKAAKVRR